MGILLLLHKQVSICLEVSTILQRLCIWLYTHNYIQIWLQSITSARLHSSRVLLVKLQGAISPSSQTPPLLKSPPQYLLATNTVEVRLKLEQGHGIIAVSPIRVSGHTIVITRFGSLSLEEILVDSDGHPSISKNQ